MRHTLLLAFLSLVPMLQATAQDNTPRVGASRFAVTSIKPCRPEEAKGPQEFLQPLAVTPPTGNRYYQACSTIWQLAVFAYDVPRTRLRYPARLSLEFYEIDARAADFVGIDDMRLMVRHLLADRFALRNHTETMVVDLYTLTLARADGRLGPNAGPAAINCYPDVVGAPPDEKERSHCARTGRINDGVLTTAYNGMTMARFAQSISRADRIIADGTGLAGIFDLALNYEVGTFDADAPSDPRNDAAFHAALEKQLGLKLVRGKGSVEILVIDGAERPTPN